MERISTGRKNPTTCKEAFKFITPVYDDPIIVERKPDYLSHYGIKDGYAHMTFDKLKAWGAPPIDRDAYNNAFKYGVHVRDHIAAGRGLILLGPVGTGKTSLAISILRKAIDQGYNGYFISMVSLFDTMLTLIDGSAEHRLRFENRIKNSPLLVLDDFGAEYDNKLVVQKVNAIISDRVESRRPTILTTNLSVSQLQARYDARIYDRLKATSFVLKFEGQSKREAPNINEI